jgi:hypothetical protein
MSGEPRVISISRRTDIPALHAPWLQGRIVAGWVAYANPFNRRPIFVSLAPEAVRALVLWTRNPHPLLPLLPLIEERYGRRHYLHLSITGMDRRFETHGPSVAAAIAGAAALAERYGPTYVQWRFDPVIVSQLTPVTEVLGRFGGLCQRLAGITARCTVSFLDAYRGAIGHLDRAGIIVDPDYVSGGSDDLAPQADLLRRMALIAAEHGITVQTCTEDGAEALAPGVARGRCIDPDLITAIAPGPALADGPSREGCGCAASVDIGAYDSCSHGCLYCYATRSPELGKANALTYRRDGFPLDQLTPEGGI